MVTITPLISVAIPCFDAHGHLPTALESLRVQDYRNLEVFVISDDNSSYEAVCAPFYADLNITILSTGGRGTGYVHAKNLALEHASGQLFSQLDSDDYLAADYFSRIAARAMNEGACVTPRKTVGFQDKKPIYTQGHLNHYAAFATRSQLSADEYVRIPFNWQTLYRCDLIKMHWPKCFEDDLFFDCHIFEQIGYAPFESYFGYHYCIRQGSICHSDDSIAHAQKNYHETIARLSHADDLMGLTPQTCALLIAELRRRLDNIAHFLNDQAAGSLRYQPDAIIDVLHYPQASN